MFKKIIGLLICTIMLLPSIAHGETAVPSKLDAPTGLRAELKNNDDGRPYFYLESNIPKSIFDLDSQRPGEGWVDLEVDRKIDDGKWYTEEFGSPSDGGGLGDLGELKANSLVFGFECQPIDEGGLTTVDIKAHTYSFRIRFNYSYYGEDGSLHDNDLMSPFSNVVSIGSGTFSKTDRLSGASRIDTAIAVSKEGWPSGAGTVILTRDDNYPDALTGAPLSKKLDAPILFTDSKTLTAATEIEIARLKAKNVIILGGTGAVSQNIENKLNQSYKVQRIGGIDRYETAAKIAKELGYKGKAVITTGEDFHDALIVSPLAAYKGIPILLTLPDSLPSSTKDALEFVASTETTIVGSTSSVSDNVAAGLTNVKRISGNDIYQTAVIVAGSFNADAARVFLATGKDFPDALSGSALAAKYNSPILFVDEPLSDYVKQYLTENKVKTTKINLLGGEGAISASTKSAIDQIYK